MLSWCNLAFGGEINNASKSSNNGVNFADIKILNNMSKEIEVGPDYLAYSVIIKPHQTKVLKLTACCNDEVEHVFFCPHPWANMSECHVIPVSVKHKKKFLNMMVTNDDQTGEMMIVNIGK
jgi:hypothetical protein